MTRDELLATLLAERNDYRWFATPPRDPRGDYAAGMRKVLLDDAEDHGRAPIRGAA